MVEGPRRIISFPIRGDPWRYQSVQGHISAPVAPWRSTTRSDQHFTIPNLTSVAVSQTLQKRKRYRNASPSIPHHAVTQSGHGRRRRVEPEPSTPTRSLIDDYIKRKAATTRFPLKITLQHIRVAMGRYEQAVQDACADVETSCASCGGFIAKAESKLIHIDDLPLTTLRIKMEFADLDIL
jgi:hypothetical protein